MTSAVNKDFKVNKEFKTSMENVQVPKEEPVLTRSRLDYFNFGEDSEPVANVHPSRGYTHG